MAFDPASRLIVRAGQATIEVDSLESSMAELRRIAQEPEGSWRDASVQSGRNQLRSATLELKVPASRFDELTEGLEPLGRLQFVNVGAEDVSEEFVDLTARAANGRRLEDRLVELQLSTLSVNLYEPPPIVASHPGRSVIAEAFKTASRLPRSAS